MSITVTVAAAIFFLGAAVGSLLTRLQWRAFKQKVSREMMEQLGGDPSIESEPSRIRPSERCNVHSPVGGRFASRFG